MTSSLAVPPKPETLSDNWPLSDVRADRVAAYVASADSIMLEAWSSNTLKAYQSGWRVFEGFCIQHDLDPLPPVPEAILAFLEAGVLGEVCVGNAVGVKWKMSTVCARVAAITAVVDFWLQQSGSDGPNPARDPAVKRWIKARRRIVRDRVRFPDQVETVRRSRAITRTESRRMIGAMDNGDVRSVRDTALVLIGIWSGCRRSEIAQTRWEDLTLVEEGTLLRIPRSKTDQAGVGRSLILPNVSDPIHSAPAAIEAWRLAAANQDLRLTELDQRIFRQISRYGAIGDPLGDEGVGRIIKRRTQEAGLGDGYTAHGLRAGAVTQMRRDGADHYAIGKQTGHKSHAIIDSYIREEDLLRQSGAMISARVVG